MPTPPQPRTTSSERGLLLAAAMALTREVLENEESLAGEKHYWKMIGMARRLARYVRQDIDDQERGQRVHRRWKRQDRARRAAIMTDASDRASSSSSSEDASSSSSEDEESSASSSGAE